jgi:hypothetical protein
VASIDRTAHPWGSRAPYEAGAAWPVRVDACLADDLRLDDVAQAPAPSTTASRPVCAPPTPTRGGIAAIVAEELPTGGGGHQSRGSGRH